MKLWQKHIFITLGVKKVTNDIENKRGERSVTAFSPKLPFFYSPAHASLPKRSLTDQLQKSQIREKLTAVSSRSRCQAIRKV